MKRRCFFLLMGFFLFVILTSCATTDGYRRDTRTGRARGVWHRVHEGQTLWRIAKTYRVTLEEIKSANDMDDVVHIARGTWVFIPNAESVLYVQGNVETPLAETEDVEFVWPVKGDVVRPFGKTENDFHYGIDIRPARGGDVVSSQGGKVVLAGMIRGYGNTIIIEHDNNYCTLYSKNIKSFVTEGQMVKKNHVIAKASGTGDPASNVVHYELFFKGKPVNPLYYLP